MSRRVSLREFQEHLSRRLAGVAEGGSSATLLGIQSEKSSWLFDLSASGEIVSLPPLMSVPLTAPFFLGLANIRGKLHAVSDFSAFLGEDMTTRRGVSGNRLLLVGTRFGSNAALLVSRILGLRNPADFTVEAPTEGAEPWEVATYVDQEGKKWRRLDMAALLSDSRFMNVVA
ncbi:MAG: chemotaxis protein CheW [Zoogloeaceae bacterium]|jgi:twitching motility protein PilI|nr:chemotaxis protein CheW [Zoogloeaceae bacterium]